MKKALTIIALLVACIAYGQSPKHEFRATWLATVYQLDWPKTATISSNAKQRPIEIAAQKEEMIGLLDALAKANMNAVFFQVRSRCDAMYKSSYEPWSTDLVESRGLDPGYDPLAFVVEESHKRGIEVHAWLNPYRYESNTSAAPWNGPNDYATTHPEWLIRMDNKSILNPGIPEVRQRITDIVGEIVTNYDVDGIVFDDYFYLQGTTNEDSEEQNKYKPADMNVKDWRRSNVNAMIASVYKKIQEIKPYVRFGASPAGVWDAGKAAADKYGINNSPITAGYQYNGIYSDPVAWLNEGTIDYISPQIYWTIGSQTDYKPLSEWWSYAGRHFNRHFYSSHTLSGLDANLKSSESFQIGSETVSSSAFSGIERGSILQIKEAEKKLISRAYGFSEIYNQIQCNRDYDLNDAPGSVFYSTRAFYKTRGFIDQLRSNKFNTKVLPPAVFWKQHADYGMVSNIAVSGSQLSWNAVAGNIRYAVYAIPLAEVNLGTALNAKNLLGISYSNGYALPTGVSSASHTFSVAILDRFGNEFAPALMNKPIDQTSSASLVAPASGVPVMLPVIFRWDAVIGVSSYRIELSEKADFSILVAARETSNTFVSSNDLFPISDKKNYYWRVISRKLGAKDGVSAVRSFGATSFAITAPTNGSTNATLTPKISWVSVGEGASYKLEVATDNLFSTESTILSRTVRTASFTLPEELLVGFSTYYARVITKIAGEDVATETINFITGEFVPQVPVIITPINGSENPGASLVVKWQKNICAKSFRVELSQYSDFPVRNSKIKTIDPFIYECAYDNLALGTWYLRMCAKYSNAQTDWTPTVAFTMSNSTDIQSMQSAFDVRLSTSATGEKELLINLDRPRMVAVELYSLSGYKLINVVDRHLLQNSQTIDLSLSGIPTGAYLLRVQMDGIVKTLKFIK